MEDFAGRLAVVTGGGTGMGRELARQLAGEGCHVAMCDVSEENIEEARSLCVADAAADTLVTTHIADVSDEAAVVAFAAEVAEVHDTQHINLLFNNAGIGGGGSFVADERDEWDKTFAVCWGGVYHGTRAFLPMLMASDAGHVVNTSSVNGFWASLGPTMPHTAYSAAKFAVKGFTEALVTDFRLHAPHLHASVVMPGHIGTSIVINSGRILGRDPKDMDADQISELRAQLARRGIDTAGASDEDLRQGMQMMAEGFRDLAPTSATEAATMILDGVRNQRWRILVGDDAVTLDDAVRREPEEAYEARFWERIRGEGVFASFL